MIVISVGLQKSGSGLFFNLTNDLLIASGKADIRHIREEYNLDNILNYYNCNIGDLNQENLNYLLPIHDAGSSFVVKTHNGPTKFVEELMAQGKVKTTCIIRDPRDVVLSALDHGKKIINEGKNHTFASCTTIENTIPTIKYWLDNNIMKWLEMDSHNLLKVKYEHLIAHPAAELKRLTDFLDIRDDHIDFDVIYARYHDKKLDDFQKDYLHFNKGIPGRFRRVLQEKDLKQCREEFSQYLEKMGYEI